jgi:hypothetical protein
MSSPSIGQPWSDPPATGDSSATPPAKPPSKPAAVPVERIGYLAALRFPTQHPEWLKNVVLFGLCLLIPVLGVLIQFGYAYEITELQHRRPGSIYPKFDFNRFAVYVTRGVWAFLIFFIVQTVLSVLYQILFQVTMFGTMAIVQANEETGTIFAAIVIPVVIIGFLSLIVAVMTCVRPLMLRAGLSQDFAQTVKFPWLMDFLRRMWRELLLINLFHIVLSLALLPAGLLLCCIGMVFLSAFLAIAGAHFDWQLYELYLARGGEPIPLKPLPADVPPVAMK